jgi:hypothetical protein
LFVFLGRQPIQISLHDVDVELGFEDRAQLWSDAKVLQRAAARKERDVAALVEVRRSRWLRQKEEHRRRQLQGKNPSSSMAAEVPSTESSSYWGSMVSSLSSSGAGLEALVRKAVDNLEMTVTNLHVRIEGSDSWDDSRRDQNWRPFVCGFSLRSFTVKTDSEGADNSGSAGGASSAAAASEEMSLAVGERTGAVFKDVTIDRFAVYWDSSTAASGLDVPSPATGSNFLSVAGAPSDSDSDDDVFHEANSEEEEPSSPEPPIPQHQEEEQEHEFLVHPVSPCLKLAMRRVPGKRKPRVDLLGSCGDSSDSSRASDAIGLGLSLNASQADDMVRLNKWLSEQRMAELRAATRTRNPRPMHSPSNRPSSVVTADAAKDATDPSHIHNNPAARQWWRYLACAVRPSLIRAFALRGHNSQSMGRFSTFYLHRLGGGSGSGSGSVEWGYTVALARWQEEYAPLFASKLELLEDESPGSATSASDDKREAKFQQIAAAARLAAISVELAALELDRTAPEVAAARACAHARRDAANELKRELSLK